MADEATKKWGNGLVELSSAGLFCRAGNFHIDPWRGVDRAVITHAHADHARRGSTHYQCALPGRDILQLRLGTSARIEGIPYGERIRCGQVWVSFHPAGHVLGSAQIRIEMGDSVAVVTGDYKRHHDASCHPFEVVECDTIITESTFGLPIYRWPAPASVFADMVAWCRDNAEQGFASVLYAYSLGKAQRVLRGLDGWTGGLGVHPAVAAFLPLYRQEGFAMPEVLTGVEAIQGLRGGGIYIAPPSVAGASALARLGEYREAGVSGWMAVRGMRRRQSYDRGFVLSDHADWPGLVTTLRETGAQYIGVTHGYLDECVRYWCEQGKDAFVVPTRFTGELLLDAGPSDESDT